MSKVVVIKIGVAGLPDAERDQKIAAYQVLLIASIQLATNAELSIPGTSLVPITSEALRCRLEAIFNRILDAGTFEKAGVRAQALDDLCGELGLFKLLPYRKQVVVLS